MNTFNDHVFRQCQICMCEIPDRFNAVLNKDIRHFHCLGFGNGQCGDLNLIVLKEVNQLIHHPDRNTPDGDPFQAGIHIKKTLQNKSASLKGRIICKRLPQITRTDDNKIMCLIQAQDLADLCVEIFHIVPVALLSESSEIIQILTDLRCGHMHLFAQIVRGYPLHTRLEQIPQIPVISWKSGDDCAGYFSMFQSYRPPLIVSGLLYRIVKFLSNSTFTLFFTLFPI